MRRRVWFALAGLVAACTAHAAEPTACVLRKGLYDTWQGLARRSSRTLTKAGALLGSASRSTGESDAAQEIANEYRTFFECLSNLTVPADHDGGRSMCREAVGDRIGSLVCQVALYVKTNRTAGTELLDALPAGKKGAEMIWDLDTIGDAGAVERRFPPLFAPRGPAYKIIDELFVLALDNRETAMSKYFQIVGAASGAGTQHTDTQIKILLRESPMLVVKHWAVLRQYQPKLKTLLGELFTELSNPEMNKVRQGITNSCGKDNLDCPEIQKFFARVQ